MENSRIILRPWRDSDAETLFKWASDPDVGPRAGWPPHKSVEESLEIILVLWAMVHRVNATCLPVRGNHSSAIGWRNPIGIKASVRMRCS